MSNTGTEHQPRVMPFNFQSVFYLDDVSEALKHSDVLSLLSDPHPLAFTVLFKSPQYPSTGVQIEAEILPELISAAQAQGLGVAPLQEGLKQYEQAGGSKLALMRYQLFDKGFDEYYNIKSNMNCSLARLQGLKFVEWRVERNDALSCCIFTDPQDPNISHDFWRGSIKKWLEDAGDDKKLIPEFVKAQKQAQKDKYKGMAIAGVAVVGMACAAVWAILKVDDHIAQRYFDPDEVVSNQRTGRYLVNTKRGTVADGPLPTTGNQPVTVYDVFAQKKRDVQLGDLGYYYVTPFAPVTDYKKLGHAVAAWNSVQGKIDVNAERLTEIFAREAKLATELQAAREMRQSAVATRP